MADLNVLDVKVPTSYTLYTKYLSQLKTFYDILGNTLYDTRILPDRSLFYKEKKSDTWIKIVPPKFMDSEQVLNQWKELKNSVMKVQQAQAEIFFKDQSQISPDAIKHYNDLVNNSNLIDQEIKKLSESESGDITEKLEQLKADKYHILGDVPGHTEANSLANLLELRQSNYTWKGDNLKEYLEWKEKWMTTPKYKNWSQYNKLYHQQLEKLGKINANITDYTNLGEKLEDFSEYKMKVNPVYDPHSSGPGAYTVKPIETKKPLQPKPAQQPITIIAPPKPVIAPPKPVIAPPTPINAPPTPVNVPPTPVNVLPKPAETPVVVTKIPIATKTPIKTKIPIATKTPIVVQAPAPVPTPAESQPIAVEKEISHKDVIASYIQALGKPDVESKLKVSAIEKLLKIMSEKKVVPSFPQVGLFISQMKQEGNPSYTEIAKSGINHMTFKSLLNNIYAKINGK